MIEHNVSINGITVHAEYSEQAAEGIFLPLLKRLTQMQREKERRGLFVMLRIMR